jgi:restriction system protein
VPGAKKKYESALRQAEEEYQVEMERWTAAENERNSKLQALRENYENEKAAFELKRGQRNAEVTEFEDAYKSGDPEAILSYNNMVLERSEYPDGFPQEFRLAYTPESKQLVVEYELPSVKVVPVVTEYRYVKTKDEITEKPRKQGEIKELYQDIVAAVALRTIHEVLEADQSGHLEVVCFNGFIQTVDPATGQDIRPHLISVRTTRQRFNEIDLARVDKRACLRNLGAQVSPRPAEAQPVKPVVEFDMVDRRFVDQSDVLTDLESRPNLMELNPFEFEHLVANLFEQMGLEAKLTRSSKDGGVDCVAFDPRPVFGGKVVIQAKRYRHTVGVSAVRDLYGTMMNEGANKGILVTTSGYGPDAFDFSKDKPIELIDGGGLLYLLQEVGIEARIIFPEE